MKKKNIIIIIGIAIICSISLFLIKNQTINKETLGAISLYTTKTTSTASTSPTYMTPGTATTTITISQDKGGFPSVFIALTASTSPSILNWDYQFSNNGVDWYGEDLFADIDSTVSLVGTEYHASTTPVHFWQPGSTTASTTRKVLNIPEVMANFARVTFSVPVGSVNSSLYVEITR